MFQTGNILTAGVMAEHYAEGVGLPERIRQIQSLDRDVKSRNEAYRLRFDLIRQLLLGLRDDMEEGEGGPYVHQDLKPENIRVKVWEDENHIVRQQLRILDNGGSSGLRCAGMIMYYILKGTEYDSEEDSEEGSEDLFAPDPLHLGFAQSRPALAQQLTRLVRDMIRGEQTRYHTASSVIREYYSFLRGYYGDYFAPQLKLLQYLEHIPGQEEKAPRRSLFCQVRETDAGGQETGISCWRSFTLYDGMLLRLTYGQGGNISTPRASEIPVEIGAVSYLAADTARPIAFIPYSRAARAEEKDGKLTEIIFEERDPDGKVRGTLELSIAEF